ASSDGSGALGTLFIKVTDLNRRTVDLLRPQALYYDLNPAHGSKQLLGVGYFVPDVGQRPPDTPIGHMEGPLPATPQQPSHFQLNAWIYRDRKSTRLNSSHQIISYAVFCLKKKKKKKKKNIYKTNKNNQK